MTSKRIVVIKKQLNKISRDEFKQILINCSLKRPFKCFDNTEDTMMRYMLYIHLLVTYDIYSIWSFFSVHPLQELSKEGLCCQV